MHFVHCKHRGSCFFVLPERASRQPFIELLFVQKHTNLFADSTALSKGPGSLHERHSSMNFRFMWPCVVTNVFLIKPRDTLISQIYFCQKILHVSGSSSGHHQEFSTVYLALVYIMQVWWHIPEPNEQWKTPDDGQINCPKHVEFLDKNKFGKLVCLLVLLKRNSSMNLCSGTWKYVPRTTHKKRPQCTCFDSGHWKQKAFFSKVEYLPSIHMVRLILRSLQWYFLMCFGQISSTNANLVIFLRLSSVC